MSNIEKFIFDAFVEELESIGHTSMSGGLTEFGCGSANVLCTIAANALKSVRATEIKEGENLQPLTGQAQNAGGQ